MKKENLFIVFIVLALTVLSVSCLSVQPADSPDNVGMIENATPENSVLVYGFSAEPDVKLVYVDEKNNWEAHVSTGSRCFVLPPAHKGSRLTLKDSYWIKRTSSIGTNFTNNYATVYRADPVEWSIKVPSDKPLYYMGSHSVMWKNISTWEGIEEMRKDPLTVAVGLPNTREEFEVWSKEQMKQGELYCLNAMLKLYKKTAWEPLIQERISELEK